MEIVIDFFQIIIITALFIGASLWRESDKLSVTGGIESSLE
jgi:hypothetical protein